jgi:chromosome segregation ATPase
MRIDDLSGVLEAFTDKARNVLDWETTKARRTVEAFNAERAAVQKALTELKDQHQVAKKQLDDVLKDLDRALGLAGIDRDLADGRKALEKLKGDQVKAETALEAMQTKLKDTERELNEADGAMRRLRAERTEATTHIDHIRHLLKSVA